MAAIDRLNAVLDAGDDALRFTLETVAMEAALEVHYDQHPDARPSLAELALAAAAQDGHPLAGEPELIERAARDIVERHSDADFEDVLLWAEALGGGSGVAGA